MTSLLVGAMAVTAGLIEAAPRLFWLSWLATVGIALADLPSWLC
jgi:hypothetical protein